jgi:hypothetical protein
VNVALIKHPHAAALVLSASIRIATQSQSDLAVRVAQGLRSSGVIVPSIEPEGSDKSPSETQLRYFSHEEEKGNDLRSIQTSLAQMGIQAIPTFVAEPSNQIQSKRRYFELWFASDLKTPISLMSNTELKSMVIEFAGRLHRKDSALYDHLDEISRFRRVLENPITHQSGDAIENVNRQIAAQQLAFNDEIIFVVQSDVPLANLYLTELLKRLRLQGGPITSYSAVPNMPSVNSFLLRSMYLGDLAQQLQPTNTIPWAPISIHN